MVVPGVLPRWPFIGRRVEVEAFAAARADPACTAFIVVGERGVGTSRLVEACADAAADAGAAVLRVEATAAGGLHPLGALAPLLAPGADSDGEAAFIEAVAAAGEGGDRVVLAVDHLHLVDDASAALVQRLQQAGSILLLGSVRRDNNASDAVAGLWTSTRARRIDLEPLDRLAFDTLLHRALGAPVDGDAEADLWTQSEGNPSLIRELVEGGMRVGLLQLTDGVWRAAGPLPLAGQAADSIHRRLDRLSPDDRAALEDVLVGESVGLADLERTHRAEALEALERDGFLTVRTDRRRVEVAIAHPAIADVLRRELSTIRARRLALAHAERVEAHGARRQDDQLRLALWYVDATGSADADVLLRAARLARHANDFAVVERLARAARLERPSAAAAHLLGEALYELGRFEAAEEVLAASMDLATNDDERGHLVMARATNLFWGLARVGDARAVVEAGIESVGSESMRRTLVAENASHRLHAGWPAQAMSELPSDETDPRARVEAALVLSPALAVLGRTAEAVAVSDLAFAEHLALNDPASLAHPGAHLVSKALALTEAGRLDEADELGRAGYEVAVAERVPIAKMWFALQLGRVALLRGRVALASRWFQEQVAHARVMGHRRPLRLGLAGVALSLAAVGDAPGSAAAVEEIREVEGEGFGFYAVEIAKAAAWARVASGELAAGRALLLPAADRAAESGQLTIEASARYEFVRLGGAPAEVAARLQVLAGTTDSGLVATWAAHVAGAAAGDPTQVLPAVDDFEAMGTLLFAAEAATGAADLLRRAGDQRAATALSQRAAAFVAQCEGANTPALLATSGVVPLTAREREIAFLVAQGLPSKEIAERLFLSVRTVQNHLQRIFTKLGVTSRGEVAAVLQGLEGSGR